MGVRGGGKFYTKYGICKDYCILFSYKINKIEIIRFVKKNDMSELQKIIKSKYDNDWIALSNSDKIFQLTNLVSSQKKHYGFKPQGLWLGKGDSWLRYIKDNDMTDWLTEYCSAFSIKLGSNILELKDKEDYVNFTKRYSESPFKIKWEVVAKKYDGIIAYAPRRFAFNDSLSWTYGWDITSGCIWNDKGIKNVDEIFNGCNDENFETFRGGGKINYSCVLINQKDLIGRFGQTHENLYSHHSTIEHKPSDIKGLEIGKKVDLKITGRLTNDNVDVLLVDNPYSKNKYPHITLSTAEDVSPVSSNLEIENNLEDVIPLDGVLNGVITVCRFQQGGEIEDFKKGGQLDNPKLKEWVRKLNNFGDGCLWVGKDSFADDFLNSLFNIVYLLSNIDTNFTIDTNPNNFAYNIDPDGDKVICLFDIEDVQDNGGQFEFTENTYPKQTFFDNPENDENYKLIEKGIGSLGAVYQDKRDGTILKLTASAYEVYGTSKVMIAQQENEEDSSYNFYFPTIYSIENAGVKEYRGRDKTYYAIRRKNIEPFRHESLRSTLSGKEVLKTYTIRCVLEAISEYYRIVEPTKGYAGEVLMKVNTSKPIKILREVLQSPNSFLFKKGGQVVTWKHKYNKKYGYPKNESHSLKEISKDTGVSMKGIRQIYNKGIGAYKTNPSSVRPNVTSKEQWAMARVYSSVMGGKASKVDAKELKMEKGGILNNPNFKSWFGDSKVVDENGNPLVVYHATGGNFDKFKDSIDGGSWFTSNPIVAEDFVFMGNPSIIPVYLSLKNPYIADLKGSFLQDSKEIVETIKDVNEVQSDKYDGIILKNALDYVDNPIVSDIYVSFEPTQIKSAIGNSGEYDPNNPSIIMAEGGEVCTYDFDGYDLAKMKCGNDVDVYLIPAEYDRVSIFLFENHFPLWLYYNYLSRIVISKEDVFTFKKQCLEKFEITNPVQLLVKPSNDKYWKTSPFGEPRSYMGYSSNKGVIGKLEIVLVRDGFWEGVFKERTSGLTLPNPKGVQLNTVIHEFAHLIDVIRYNEKNPNKEIIVTHQRGFLVALTDILIASKRKEIPIVSQVDNKALIIQKALQKPSFVEKYKDTYGLNVFDGTVPKDLKEYDERFAYLKGAKLNKEQAKEIFDLLKKYQDEVLMSMAMTNPNKANRLFKQINELLQKLKKYS